MLDNFPSLRNEHWFYSQIVVILLIHERYWKRTLSSLMKLFPHLPSLESDRDLESAVLEQNARIHTRGSTEASTLRFPTWKFPWTLACWEGTVLVGVKTACRILKNCISCFLFFCFRTVAIQKRKGGVKVYFLTFGEVFRVFTNYFIQFTLLKIIFGIASFKLTRREFG